MRALSLRQPYATLIAIGAKSIETRSWPTRYRGSLLIHASARLDAAGRLECETEPFRSVLAAAGFEPEGTARARRPIDRSLPLGAIVACCELVDCRPVIDLVGPRRREILTRHEEAFGDYAPGRWAWILANVCRLGEPVSCPGRLGIWVLPSDVEPKVETALAGGRALSSREEGNER